MKLKPYPQYKPSRIEWLGNVPEHWAVARLKYVATVNDEQLSETMEPSFEMAYIDIRSVDTDRGITAPRRVRFEDAPSRARRVLKPGDTIVSTVRTYLRATATFHDLGANTIASTGFAVLRPNYGMSPRYLGYIAGSSPFIESVCGRSVGVSYPAVNASDIRTILVTHPNRREQEAVATFLDHQTAKIDALINKTEILIERLDEKRRALITEAVTRGLPPDENRKACLDPHPKLKPSGAKWLRDAPGHWQIWQLRYVATHVDRVIDDDSDDHRHLFIGMESVESWTGDLIDLKALATHAASSSSRGFLRRDVLFGKLRPYLAKSCRPDFDGLCSGEFLVLDGNEEIDNRYLLYLMLSQYIVALADASAYGTKMPRTNWREVRSFPVPVPPVREQKTMCSYLDNTTMRIDDLTRKAGTLIDRLREKRQALITAAVTGQIDVRGAQEGETT